MTYPTNLADVNAHLKVIRKAYRKAGVPDKLLRNIETRALRSGRRQTGEFRSNRDPRWTLNTADPQFGTEIDCRIIFAKLLGSLLSFRNPPAVDPTTVSLIEQHYLLEPVAPGTYKDALLLETLDYEQLAAEVLDPTHGHSNFHIGHHDPTLVPKHVPTNIFWRTHRSNLIQGNMTIREARIYIIKLIGRYFELGELNVT